MKNENIDIHIKSDKINIKNDKIDIENYYNYEKSNKRFNKKRISAKKSISDNNIIPSEEQLFRVRNKLLMKDDEIKTIDEIKENEIQENDNKISDKENIQVEKKEEKKGFFGRTIEWMDYIFHEIPLFWKKEEMIKGYDANGNIVYRPKKKIPLKEKNNFDLDKLNVENEANDISLDFAKKGINYSLYFN